ncbi:MAG: RibD family protein [Candidatus Bathyarchaeota archaeon]|nr:RibD family protein [Candidatus Bathyarchaeota archaeon]
MSPRVIMFNTISADGSIKDFELDIGLHYEIADKIKADAHLIGSETAKTGVEMFTENVPPEEPADFNKPIMKKGETKPFWVLSDSKGKLKGLLHVYRRSCYCKDVIVLVTHKTPEDYIRYLKERNYNVLVSGEETIDFRGALDYLDMSFGIRTVLTDSGGGLNSILLKEGLVDEVALLISPVVVGKGSTNLFRYLESTVNLELIRSERLRSNHLLVVYRVLTNITHLTPLHADSETERSPA